MARGKGGDSGPRLQRRPKVGAAAPGRSGSSYLRQRLWSEAGAAVEAQGRSGSSIPRPGWRRRPEAWVAAKPRGRSGGPRRQRRLETGAAVVLARNKGGGHTTCWYATSGTERCGTGGHEICGSMAKEQPAEAIGRQNRWTEANFDGGGTAGAALEQRSQGLAVQGCSSGTGSLRRRR